MGRPMGRWIGRRNRAMVDLSLQERLQPSLLDRLTDNEPKKNQESNIRAIRVRGATLQLGIGDCYIFLVALRIRGIVDITLAHG